MTKIKHARNASGHNAHLRDLLLFLRFVLRLSLNASRRQSSILFVGGCRWSLLNLGLEESVMGLQLLSHATQTPHCHITNTTIASQIQH